MLSTQGEYKREKERTCFYYTYESPSQTMVPAPDLAISSIKWSRCRWQDTLSRWLAKPLIWIIGLRNVWCRALSKSIKLTTLLPLKDGDRFTYRLNWSIRRRCWGDCGRSWYLGLGGVNGGCVGGDVALSTGECTGELFTSGPKISILSEVDGWDEMVLPNTHSFDENNCDERINIKTTDHPEIQMAFELGKNMQNLNNYLILFGNFIEL